MSNSWATSEARFLCGCYLVAMLNSGKCKQNAQQISGIFVFIFASLDQLRGTRELVI